MGQCHDGLNRHFPMKQIFCVVALVPRAFHSHFDFRLAIRVSMVFLTPMHDLISSHYTPLVLHTLSRSLHHMSHLLSLSLSYSPLQGYSVEFSKQKAAICERLPDKRAQDTKRMQEWKTTEMEMHPNYTTQPALSTEQDAHFTQTTRNRSTHIYVSHAVSPPIHQHMFIQSRLKQA